MMTTTTTNEEQQQKDVNFTNSTCSGDINSNWKLYNNPFFQNPTSSSHSHFHKHLVCKYSSRAKHINKLHPDLKFNNPSSKIKSGIDQARTQIAQLKDELEFERKMRKRAECLNKMMARELVDQRRKTEQICDTLTKEITHFKSQLAKSKSVIKSQRKLFKFFRLTQKLPTNQKPNKPVFTVPSSSSSSSSCSASSSLLNSKSMAAFRRPKRSTEVENRRMRRGTKGFIKYPRVVKGMDGSRNGGSHGSKCRKMECQKIQLKVLFKHKSSLSSNSLVIS